MGAFLKAALKNNSALSVLLYIDTWIFETTRGQFKGIFGFVQVKMRLTKISKK